MAVKDARKVLLGLVVKAYNVTNEQAEAMVSEAEENEFNEDSLLADLLNKDKAKVKTLRTDAFNDGHKKAKGEALTAFEDEIREMFGVNDPTLKGADLIKSVVQTQNKQDGKATLTDDDVKRHPLFVQLQDAQKAAVKKANEEWQAKYEALDKGYKTKETNSLFTGDAMRFFDTLKPILPTDPTLAANQRRFLEKAILDGNTFEKQGDRWVILDTEGKVREDGHGNAIDFQTFVKGVASQYFGFNKTDVGGNSGNQNRGGNDQPGGKRFKNEADFMKFSEDKTIPIDERMKAAEEWNAQQAGGSEE